MARKACNSSCCLSVGDCDSSMKSFCLWMREKGRILGPRQLRQTWPFNDTSDGIKVKGCVCRRDRVTVSHVTFTGHDLEAWSPWNYTHRSIFQLQWLFGLIFEFTDTSTVSNFVAISHKVPSSLRMFISSIQWFVLWFGCGLLPLKWADAFSAQRWEELEIQALPNCGRVVLKGKRPENV